MDSTAGLGMRPLVGRERALKLLSPSPWNLPAAVERTAVRLLPALRPMTAEGKLPKLEMIWMPCHKVRITLSSAKANREEIFLAGAWTGQATLVRDTSQFEDMIQISQNAALGESAEHAVEAARAAMLRMLQTIRGVRGLYEIEKAEAEGIVQYPYWVYYFERGRGKIDIRMIDARSAADPGIKVKYGLLEMLKSSRSSTLPSPA